MDIMIISSENNILHICNNEYTADYTIYDCKGHLLDGGDLESNKGRFKNDLLIETVTNIIKETFSFSHPYIYLTGDKAESLLYLVQEEEYRHTQNKVQDYLASNPKNTNFINSEMELEK